MFLFISFHLCECDAYYVGSTIQAYWDWSWDELVASDFPATIEYVHHLTGQKMHYIGHSQVNLAHCFH